MTRGGSLEARNSRRRRIMDGSSSATPPWPQRSRMPQEPWLNPHQLPRAQSPIGEPPSRPRLLERRPALRAARVVAREDVEVRAVGAPVHPIHPLVAGVDHEMAPPLWAPKHDGLAVVAVEPFDRRIFAADFARDVHEFHPCFFSAPSMSGGFHPGGFRIFPVGETGQI